jgi:predicted Rossmann fold flavoprotein
MPQFDLIVIGGGAAGFYGAIQAAELNPRLRILILEKSNRVLSKVRVSGGGRCNVTHHCFDPVALSKHYPRGKKSLQSVFKDYDAKHTVNWFSAQGVQLKVESDGRMFPITDDSQTIIQCFLSEAQHRSIIVETGNGVVGITRRESVLEIETQTGKKYTASKVLVAVGGSPKPEAYSFVIRMGHTIKAPIPSLFTFNDPERKFADLMGISVDNALVRIAGTDFTQDGPVLITHWGLSGPAVIRLSAWAAEYLYQQTYKFNCLVSWIGSTTEQTLNAELEGRKMSTGKQKVYNHPLFGLPQRLWTRLCALAEIPAEKIWAEMSRRHINKLIENLLRCPFHINGKTTFKEEFVTCGGVDLREINLQSMESLKVPGIFFAGEVLNIDGETGGYNFQNAWSTAFLAARSIASTEQSA